VDITVPFIVGIRETASVNMARFVILGGSRRSSLIQDWGKTNPESRASWP
jgi:hypothetical protein